MSNYYESFDRFSFLKFYISFFVVDAKHSLSLWCACASMNVYYCCADKCAKSGAVAIAWFSPFALFIITMALSLH